MPQLAYLLKELAASIHLRFRKNQTGRLRNPLHILSKALRAFLEESALIHQNHPSIGKEGHSLRLTHDLLGIRVFSLKGNPIHLVIRGEHGLAKPLSVLADEVALLAIEEVDGFDCSLFNVLNDGFHLKAR